MSSQDTLRDKFNRIVARTAEKILPELQAADKNIQTIGFQYGPWLEIQAKLIDMTKNDTQKWLKFPMIAIIESFPQAEGKRYPEVTLQAYIFHHTNKNFDSAQRDQIIYKPILEPIRNEFIRQISLSSYFNNPIAALIPYTRLDLKNFGKQSIYGSDGQILAEYLDAMYLKDLKLMLNPYTC